MTYTQIQTEYAKLFDAGINTAPNIPDLRFTYESFCARIDAVDPEKRKKHALSLNAKYHLIRILLEINK